MKGQSSDNENYENLEMDRVNTDIELPFEKVDALLETGDTFEILIKKFNLKIYEPNFSTRRHYNQLNFNEVILPRINEIKNLNKLKLIIIYGCFHNIYELSEKR